MPQRRSSSARQRHRRSRSSAPPATAGARQDRRRASGLRARVHQAATRQDAVRRRQPQHPHQPHQGHRIQPLTEARQIPSGSTIDARAGTLQLITATGTKGKTQAGIFNGGLFTTTQSTSRIAKGMTTLTMLGERVPRRPELLPLPRRQGARRTRGQVQPILQTLHARDSHGRFRTKGLQRRHRPRDDLGHHRRMRRHPHHRPPRHRRRLRQPHPQNHPRPRRPPLPRPDQSDEVGRSVRARSWADSGGSNSRARGCGKRRVPRLMELHHSPKHPKP